MSGSQFLSNSIAVAKLLINSEMTPHSKGQGAPPKVSLSVISAIYSSGIWVQDCTAVKKCRQRLWKAALKSILVEYILLLGCLFLATTVELTSRCTTPP